MPNLAGIPTNISALELRSKLGEVIDKAVYQKRTFIVKRAGKATVAIMPLEEYKELVGEHPTNVSKLIDILTVRFPDIPRAELQSLVSQVIQDLDRGKDTTAVETLALMLNDEMYDSIQASITETGEGKKIPLDDAFV